MNDSVRNPSGDDPRLRKHRRSSILNYDDVDIDRMLAADGCELLSIGREIVMTGTRRRVYKTVQYIASCGHEHTIRLSKYLAGRGRVCPKCSHPKGEKHFAYNPNITDEERLANRDTYDNIRWRKAVYERDGYTCKVCGDSRGGNLVAHHLDSYADHPEIRYDLDNGVTLCETCHKAFHHKYTYFHNSRAQFEEWLGQDNTEVIGESKGSPTP